MMHHTMLGPGASPRRPRKTGPQQSGAELGGGSSEPLCLPSLITLLQPKEDFVDKEIQGGGVPADNCPLPTGQGRGRLVLTSWQGSGFQEICSAG